MSMCESTAGRGKEIRYFVREDSIQNHLAFQIALAVADFLFNTHRYVFAIDFYEEAFVLLNQLVDIGEVSLYSVTRNEYDTYAKSMNEELKLIKRVLQNQHIPKKDRFQRTERMLDTTTNETPCEQTRLTVLFKALGSIFFSLSCYKTSIWYYQKAAGIIKTSGNKCGEESIYTGLAIAHNAIGQFDEALVSQKKALEVIHDIGDLRGELECYNSLGSLYSASGKYDLATTCYSKSLESNNKIVVAMAHNNLGIVYLSSGQYAKSIEQHKASLRLKDDFGDTKGMSITYINLSCVYYAIGQYETAIMYQEKAREISEKIGDKKQLAVCYSNLGGLNHASSDHQLSLDNHFKALKIRLQIGDTEGQCRSYNELSSVYDDLGQLRDSVTYHERARKLESVIIKKGGKRNVARRHVQWISHQERGLEIIEEIGIENDERLILYKVGLSHLSRLGYLDASEYFAGEIRQHEINRRPLSDENKVFLDELNVPVYKALALDQLSNNHYSDALLTLEQGRARALVDLVLRKYTIQEEFLFTFDNLHSITSFLVTQENNFLFMATLLDAMVCLWFIDKLGTLSFKSYFVSNDEMYPTLLGFFCHEDRPGASPKTAPKEKRVRSFEDVDELVPLLRFSSVRSVPFLHQVIFGFASNLPDEEEIVFVPEGPMFQVPFAALQDVNGNYLTEKVRVRIVPSLTTLKTLQDLHAEDNEKLGALVIGDPHAPYIRHNGRCKKLHALPYAREEAELIGKLLCTSPLVGKQATKEAVLHKISKVSLVHIAAHGDAEEGEIALAADDPTCEEGCVLTLRDMANVGIRAKLVVLSTCHSGRGRMTTAEGVVGMARSFLGCGARSVICSLWAIDDETTLHFMTLFYNYLINHGMSASRALRLSMRNMRASEIYADVRKWAPFVLYGDDVTFDLNEFHE